ncbi:MAG TPA: HAD family hydrolase [Gaiellaceae bacterium]
MERWATFDCYGTLVDWRAGIGGELARLFGDDRAAALLERYYAIEPDVQADGSLRYRDVLAETLRRVAGEAGLAIPAGEEGALGRSLPSWPVFPEAAASLAEARRCGWRLAILSNSDADLVEASIAAIGVPFDLYVVASEIGSYKPGLRHWQVFSERSGTTPAGHVHVAQSLFHDIGPASELGLASVWINRRDEGPGPVPTRELPDLEALPGTLAELVPA